MAEIDPVTGLPIRTEVDKDTGILRKMDGSGEEAGRKYDRLMGQKGKSDQLAEDIASEKGQMVLNKIQEHLLNRVNKLIDEDGECRALKKVLIGMEIDLNIGEMAVKNLMKLLIKR